MTRGRCCPARITRRSADRSSRPVACRAVAGAVAGALLSRMGLPQHHPLSLRRLCRRHRGLRSRARCQQDPARMARGGAVPARAASTGAGRDSALRERDPFVLGWIIRSDRRGRGALGPASSSDQREGRDGKPCATDCVAQGFLSRVLFSLSRISVDSGSKS